MASKHLPQVVEGRIRGLLDYDPETGRFTWRVDRRGRAKAGSEAGGLDKSTGYMQLALSHEGVRLRVLLHRLAWWYVTGGWPKGEVDHLNGIRTDNRWCNLRDGTKQLNMQNQRRARRDSLTQVQGVQFHRRVGKFHARITVDGRDRSLGYFSSADEAGHAYLEAKRRLHAGCTI